jgi:hypothetical protein
MTINSLKPKQPEPMNSLKQLLLLGSAGLASVALPSCVDPYAAHHPPHHGPPSHTVYRAGYEVRTLPHGYRTEVIGGTSYYVHGDTYYRPRSGRYVVVEAPRPRRYADRGYGRRDVVITSLPRGYRVVERGGTRYYQSGNVYYQRRGSGYMVVENPF